LLRLLLGFLAFSRVVIVFGYRIPASLYDAELNASGIPIAAALELGADTADGGTFTHGGTPLSVE
jgi:hypothetical protein